jgi:predicted XRE-type DNA-binding protein
MVAKKIKKNVSKNNIGKISSEEQEFEKYLQKIEDPKNEREINRALPLNATPLQIAKYKLCKKILAYQIKNKLTDEEIIKKLELSKAETEDILFCEIENFTVDRLIAYTSRLFHPNQIEVIVEEKKNATHTQTT